MLDIVLFLAAFIVVRAVMYAVEQSRDRLHSSVGSGGGSSYEARELGNGIGRSGGRVRIAFDDLTPVA